MSTARPSWDTLLDQHLAGRLDDAGRQAFESHLAADPQARPEFELQRQIQSSINRRERENYLREQLRVIQDELGEAQPLSGGAPRCGTLRRSGRAGWFRTQAANRRSAGRRRVATAGCHDAGRSGTSRCCHLVR